MGLDRHEILRMFLAEGADILDAAEAAVVGFTGRATDKGSIAPLLRGIHTLKGNAMVLDLSDIALLAHGMEEQIGRLPMDGSLIAAEDVQPLLDSIDALRRALPAAAGVRREEPAEVRTDAAPRRFAADDPALTPRIDIEKLDRLLGLVGELAAAHGNVRSLLQDEGGARKRGEFTDACDEIERIHLLLQEEVLGLRTIPLGPALRRYIRFAHDLASENGKLVRLVLAMEAGEVEVDTRVVVQLRDPLVHMIRNAIDHGIEAPDIRQAFGKNPTGTITIKALRDPNGIVIEISDDGAGLRRDRIVARARDQGLIGPAEEPGDAAIHELIFRHGFSTAERVNAVSGRGVGMDVVRQNVEAIRGSVTAESREGEGMTITIRLPLRVAIIGCLEVGVASELYLIPLDDVVECLDFPAALRQSCGSGVLSWRERPIPVAELRSALGVGGARPERESVVVVKHPRGPVGVVVDAVAGQSQAVVKPLGYPFNDVEGVSSAAVQSSGRVALMLDVAGLLSRTQSVTMGQEAAHV